MRHSWTAEEIAWMKENGPGRMMKDSYPDFIKAFQIQDVELPAYVAAMKRHDIKTGVSTKFKKGRPATNKGKKLTPEQYEKASKTFFKPGADPINKTPMGGEKIASGYVWIRVADIPGGTMQENFKLKHHMLWEEHYGPIGPDEVVIFLDGNKRNITIENLAKINRRENRIMNVKGLRYEDAELTKTGLAIAKVMDATYKRTRTNEGNKIRNQTGSHEAGG